MDNNLPELRDIHLPEGVAVWPPAYGWWVILTAIIVLFILVELFFYIRRKSKKRYALRLIANIRSQNSIESAAEISAILRRICIYKYKEAITLSGQQWIDFLNQHSKTKISGKAERLLEDAPYISKDTQTYTQEDFEKLSKFAAAWIGENL